MKRIVPLVLVVLISMAPAVVAAPAQASTDEATSVSWSPWSAWITSVQEWITTLVSTGEKSSSSDQPPAPAREPSGEPETAAPMGDDDPTGQTEGYPTVDPVG